MSKKQISNQKPRRRGNIYDRLEDARARRAQALAMPAPANDPKPADSPLRLVKPVFVPPSAEETETTPPPAITEDKAPEQKSGLRWHLAIVGVVLAVLTAALALRDPLLSPTAVTPIADLAMPDVPATRTTTPAVFSSHDARVTPTPLLAAEQDVAPQPLANIAPTPVQSTQSDPALNPPAISGERPRPNPRREDAEVSRASPPKLLLTDLDTLFVQPSPASLDLNLSLNVPSNVSRRALGAVEERLALLGLVPPSPKRFNFNVTRTHVRFYHEADRAKAQELAAAFDAPARDFTDFSPAPEQGFVELWVQGQPPRPVRPEPSIFDGFRRDLRQMGSDLTGAIRSIGRQRNP